MSLVRLGFVGVGSMGQVAHLRNYALRDDCRVMALAELRPHLAELVAQRYGVPRVYRDHRELLQGERQNLDALICIQPFTHHGSILPEVLAAGLPVLTEKPMAGSVEVGEQLLTHAQAAGGPWYVAYHKRSDPAVLWARHQIGIWKNSGQVGGMRYIRIVMPPGDWVASGFAALIRSDEACPASPADPAPSGMSLEHFKAFTEFVNFYIHQVNLLRHLLDEPYTVSWVDPAGVLFVGHSRSGVTGVIEMAAYRTSRAWQETALVCFEKGWIRLELPAPLSINHPGRVVVYQDSAGGSEPQQIEPQLPWVDAMQQQAAHFIQAVRGETTPLATAAEALEDLKIARQWLELRSGGSKSRCVGVRK